MNETGKRSSEPVARVLGGTNGGPFWVIEEYGHEIGHKLIDGDITPEEAVENRKEELMRRHGGDRVEKDGVYWEVYAE